MTNLPPDTPSIGPNHVVVPFVLWQRMAACYYGGAPRYAGEPISSAASTPAVNEVPYKKTPSPEPAPKVSSGVTPFRKWKPAGVATPEEMPE